MAHLAIEGSDGAAATLPTRAANEGLRNSNAFTTFGDIVI